jgi:hypothetical protein
VEEVEAMKAAYRQQHLQRADSSSDEQLLADTLVDSNRLSTVSSIGQPLTPGEASDRNFCIALPKDR